MFRGLLPRLLLALAAALATPSARAIDPATLPPPYTAADLGVIAQQAADRALESFPAAVIAIVDRDGRQLLLRRADGTGGITDDERARAVGRAGTAVFLSSNEHAFTPRTAGFIIQQNFPPRVLNRPPGPLVGVGFSNLAYSDINYFREADGVTRIPGTRLMASPGGAPLYLNGRLFAGIGVTGDGTNSEDSTITGPDEDESIALAGQRGYAPDPRIHGDFVLIDGLRLPYIASSNRAAATPGAAAVLLVNVPPPPLVRPAAVLGGVNGQLHAPIIADPETSPVAGQPRLSAAEVESIIAAAASRAAITRAGIRMPVGRRAQVFISVVNRPAAAGDPPVVLGTFRTPDAPLFSWDVSVQKARTVIHYINALPTRAYSSRTVGFLSQQHYPPGIDGRPPGPFFTDQPTLSVPLLTGDPLIHPDLPNGITIFPGGLPLYRNGVLVGAIGVSGDGIDQDDLIAAAGSVGWLPPDAIRPDFQTVNGVRLPYVKFPRNPELLKEEAPYVPGP